MTSIPVPVISARTAPLSSLRLEHRYWSNPRVHSGLDDKSLDELGADIKIRNIQVPLLVQKVLVNGDVIDLVLEGQRRVNAAQRVFPKHHPIPVVDRTPEAIDLTPELADKILLDMLSVGARREGLSPYELSESAERLRNRGRTLLDIGNAIGKSESWVSKILKARASANPQLMLRWRKGQITEEQFKELSAVDVDKQSDAAKEVMEARKGGDKGEARARSKEIVATAKTAKTAKATNGVNGPVVSGPQADMFDVDTSADKPDKPATRTRDTAAARAESHKRSTPTKLALEEMTDLAAKRPPTHDYVKGLMDAVRWMLGEIGPDKFGNAWKVYLARIDGSGRPLKSAKPARKPPSKKVGQKATKARREKQKQNKAGKRARR